VIGDLLQPTHLLFVLVIALLVLGPKRLPEVGRSLGKGLRDFKEAVSGVDPREELITTSSAPAVPVEPPAAPVEAPAAPSGLAPAEPTAAATAQAPYPEVVHDPGEPTGA